MAHALILTDCLPGGSGIKDALIEAGFSSFDHVWSEEGALIAADLRRPDLLVVGDSIEGGLPIEVARAVAARVEGLQILYLSARDAGGSVSLSLDVSAEEGLNVGDLPAVADLPAARGPEPLTSSFEARIAG